MATATAKSVTYICKENVIVVYDIVSIDYIALCELLIIV